jgi:hypothetical protein
LFWFFMDRYPVFWGYAPPIFHSGLYTLDLPSILHTLIYFHSIYHPPFYSGSPPTFYLVTHTLSFIWTYAPRLLWFMCFYSCQVLILLCIGLDLCTLICVSLLHIHFLYPVLRTSYYSILVDAPPGVLDMGLRARYPSV